jgi:hypothetical protein
MAVKAEFLADVGAMVFNCPIVNEEFVCDLFCSISGWLPGSKSSRW